MSEVVEIRTGTEVSEVVEKLARTMGDASLCLVVPKTVAEGEWVRFSIQLEDGTHVIEGVGRCDGAVPRGNPTDRYDLHLSELSFDERNEIMYERMLIAKDAAKSGDDTGVIKLEDVEMEHVEGADEVSESAPPARSVPPPPPAVSLEDAKSKRTSSAPEKRTSASPKKRASAAPKSGAKASPKKRASAAPKKRTSAAPKKRTSAAPKKRTSVSPKSGAKAGVDRDTTKVDLESPKPGRDDKRPSHRPVGVSDGPYTVEVPFDLVSEARRLTDRLPRKLLNRDRTPGRPEAAVLKTALRVGLSALRSLADDE